MCSQDKYLSFSINFILKLGIVLAGQRKKSECLHSMQVSPAKHISKLKNRPFENKDTVQFKVLNIIVNATSEFYKTIQTTNE